MQYKTVETISTGTDYTCYRAKPEKNGNVEYAIKTVNKISNNDDLTLLLKNELYTSKLLDVPGVRKAITYSLYQNKPALISEYIQGKSLDQFELRHFSFYEAVDIIIKVLKVLDGIHSKGIIHLGLRPSNILYQNGNVHLIGFGQSTDIVLQTKEGRLRKNTDSIRYISPEQTGHMNRIIDLRADYYSLGIILYELLTGQVPFSSGNAYQLMKMHVADEATPLHEIDKNVPEYLSGVVFKLLAKNADDGYNSCEGIIRDLELCKHIIENPEYKHNGFGAMDMPSIPFVSQKMVGRKAEIYLLSERLKQTIQKNRKQLILIKGESGIGKSSLINELTQLAINFNTEILSGKFDRLKQNLPYFAIIQALSGEVRNILSQKANDIEKWKKTILERTAPNTQLVTEIIPELEKIVGKQPKVEEIPISQAQNRFNRTLTLFIHALVSKDRPIILFIDDIQWADAASLQLIKNVAISPEINHLLIIMAYREKTQD